MIIGARMFHAAGIKAIIRPVATRRMVNIIEGMHVSAFSDITNIPTIYAIKSTHITIAQKIEPTRSSINPTSINRSMPTMPTTTAPITV